MSVNKFTLSHSCAQWPLFTITLRLICLWLIPLQLQENICWPGTHSQLPPMLKVHLFIQPWMRALGENLDSCHSRGWVSQHALIRETPCTGRQSITWHKHREKSDQDVLGLWEECGGNRKDGKVESRCEPICRATKAYCSFCMFLHCNC